MLTINYEIKHAELLTDPKQMDDFIKIMRKQLEEQLEKWVPRLGMPTTVEMREEIREKLRGNYRDKDNNEN